MLRLLSYVSIIYYKSYLHHHSTFTYVLLNKGIRGINYTLPLNFPRRFTDFLIKMIFCYFSTKTQTSVLGTQKHHLMNEMAPLKSISRISSKGDIYGKCSCCLHLSQIIIFHNHFDCFKHISKHKVDAKPIRYYP